MNRCPSFCKDTVAPDHSFGCACRLDDSRKAAEEHLASCSRALARTIIRLSMTLAGTLSRQINLGTFPGQARRHEEAYGLFAVLGQHGGINRLNLTLGNGDLTFLVSAKGAREGNDANRIAGRCLVLCRGDRCQVLLFMDQGVSKLLAALAGIGSHGNVCGNDSVWSARTGRQNTETEDGKKGFTH